jgi:hypothetical protein
MNDKVLTVAIGRNYGKNQQLTAGQWQGFRNKTKNLIQKHAKIVAVTHGRGIASDGTRRNKVENTFVIVAINPQKVKKLRNEFVGVLRHYHQYSGAFSLDRKHTPVFSKRPPLSR